MDVFLVAVVALAPKYSILETLIKLAVNFREKR